MKRIARRKQSVGKVAAGILIGSVVGATIGWLTAPVSGMETRRRLTNAAYQSRRSLQEKIKTSEGNVESMAHKLTDRVAEGASALQKKATGRGKEALPINDGE